MKLIRKINIFFLAMGFILVLSACGEKMVSVPSSADNYTGLYFQTVIDELKKAGFSDIDSTILEDLSSYSDLTDGAVESVTINDSTSFVAKEKFLPESKVVVTYHIIPKCSPAIPTDKLQNFTCDEIGRAYTDAGFTDVSITDAYDLDPDEVEVEFINEVSIGGITSFKSNDEIPFDTPVVVTCHYPYKKYTVKLAIDFVPNLIFSKYDVDLLINGKNQCTLDHGIDAEYEFRLREGETSFTFSNADSPSVKGEITLPVNCDIDASYKIYCYSDKVGVEEIFVDYKTTLMDDETKVMDSKYEFIGKNYRDVVATLEGLGFTNIKTAPEYDIIWGITETESISSVSIGGRTDFKRGSVFKKDTEIVIVYHMPYDSDPSKQEGTSNSESQSNHIEETLEVELTTDTEVFIGETVQAHDGKLTSIQTTELADEFMVTAGIKCKNSENTVTEIVNDIAAYIKENPLPEAVVLLFADINDSSEEVLVMATILIDGTAEISSMSLSYNSAHNEWINSQFSGWNGANKPLEKLVKQNLNDEKSYKHIETNWREVKDEDDKKEINQILADGGYSKRVEVGDLFIALEFSAKNSFNATIKNVAIGIASYKDSTITLVDIL